MGYVQLKDNGYLYFSDSNRIVNSGFKEVFLQYESSQKIEWEDVKVDEDIVKSRIRNLKQIIFEISQRCNMQCAYCTYGGEYSYQRTNSNKSISLETARKTIDYIHGFIEKRPKKELIIGAYGGEPLIKFDIIERIVNYSKQVFPGWKLRFTITTNGTLLNEKIISFLIKNRFSLNISLDGNEKNHNAKRIFPDGSGTFRLIMENMAKIKAIDRNYYYEYVSYFITFSKDLPIDEIYHFFLTDDRVTKNNITINFVNHLDTNYYAKNPYDEAATNIKINNILKIITDKKANGHALAPIEEDLFTKIVEMAKKTDIRQISFLAETCLFDSRLYIDADGTFHICERMNDQFPIGDCHNGFDFSRMKQLAYEFMSLIKEKCFDCDARFLCSRCYIHFAKNGKFEMNSDFCDMNKGYIKKLENIIELKEIGVL